MTLICASLLLFGLLASLWYILYLQKEIVSLKVEKASLETRLQSERGAFEEKLKLLEETKETLAKAFKTVSYEALEQSNHSFFQMAKSTFDQRKEEMTNLIDPMKTSLKELETKVDKMGALEKQLYEETHALSRALRSPNVRGRWGEIQLKRVVEIAGMLKHCDFYEQFNLSDGEEGRLRPDLLIRLPGNRHVIVDAKVPLGSYLEAMEENNEEIRKLKFKEYSKHLKNHVSALGKKSYWEFVQPAPEFVLLFLSSETFFSTALEHDPTLIEHSMDQGVIITTPTNLIALLRTIAYGWKQEELSKNAQHICQLGQELYKRVNDMLSHFEKMGRSLKGAVEDYNRTLGSLESRVLVSARKLKDLQVTAVNLELTELKSIENMPRLPHPEIVP